MRPPTVSRARRVALVGAASVSLVVAGLASVGASTGLAPLQTATAFAASIGDARAGEGSATSSLAAAPYSPTPPPGITCRATSQGAVTYECTIGHSVDGRAIVAMRQGGPAAARVLVVDGQMHGEEWPGPMTVDVLRRLPTSPSATFQIWTIRSMNPDGGRIGRRFNSHGVNLNANFPDKFVPGPRAGRKPLSEPESAAVARFLLWVRPDLVISLHGFSEAVDTTGGGRRAAWARTFSALSRVRPAHIVPCGGPCHGNLTDWYTRVSPTHGVAFTVEMPRSSRVVRRCGVPGRAGTATPIVCAAWAAYAVAARLPA
jgi:murein peptide amidase A